MIKTVVIAIIAILSFIFPACLINAIRAETDELSFRYKTQSCACFGFIMLLLALLVNS